MEWIKNCNSLEVKEEMILIEREVLVADQRAKILFGRRMGRL